MILLGERPDLLVIVGTPVIVVGLLLVVMPRRGANSGDGVVNVRRLGYLLAIGSASRDAISRHVVTDLIDPLVSAGLALAIGGTILAVILHRQVARSVMTVPRKYLLICALAGVFQGLAVASLFQALSRAPVTVVSPIYASQPLLTLILAHFFLKRLEAIDFLCPARIVDHSFAKSKGWLTDWSYEPVPEPEKFTP